MNLDELKKFTEYEHMTVRQLAMLFLLDEQPELQLKWAAYDLGIPKAGVCRTWDALEEKKLMKRRRSVDDNRLVFGSLTDKGQKMVDDVKTKTKGGK